MKFVAGLLALAAALTILGKPAVADEKACPASKPEHHPAAMPWDILKGLDLTDEQKAKLKELHKEFGPKFKAAADSILTDEQKKARDDAVKEAKAAGKKGPEVWKAAMQAEKLTDEQKAKLHEVMTPLHKQFHEKLMALLTTEQREQLKQKLAAVKPEHHGKDHCHLLHGLNLTDDQKAKVKALHKEFHEKLLAILTPEQQAQLKQKCEKHDKACK
jgi:Spy/CpxP family protein refolding chaperone